eukprot:507407-Rhodomonas_salina.4
MAELSVRCTEAERGTCPVGLQGTWRHTSSLPETVPRFQPHARSIEEFPRENTPHIAVTGPGVLRREGDVVRIKQDAKTVVETSEVAVRPCSARSARLCQRHAIVRSPSPLHGAHGIEEHSIAHARSMRSRRSDSAQARRRPAATRPELWSSARERRCQSPCLPHPEHKSGLRSPLLGRNHGLRPRRRHTRPPQSSSAVRTTTSSWRPPRGCQGRAPSTDKSVH